MRLDVYSMLYFCLNQICTNLQSTSCSSLIELDGHIHFLYIASTLQTSTFVSEIICNNNRVPVRTATLLRSSDLKVHVILSFGASSQTPRDTGRSGTLPWCQCTRGEGSRLFFFFFFYFCSFVCTRRQGFRQMHDIIALCQDSLHTTDGTRQFSQPEENIWNRFWWTAGMF